ncbi:DUF4386 domain-containing protein [Planomonospora sp. ID67723]|uniref:DUF4386 domain-containing protein n=1 Tax=Planomonospora sp. ID67723 TaxID=2738134 RepID=UPI0018C3594F|nr:DUF4386 domain-containing protein [Planomonospora sp. ID67723]MBG0828127.1 DUF4386 domain-containing protein [Planomonospora sp. ID67723]
MGSPKRVARLAGVFYLAVAVFALFAQMYARATVYVPGDAAATAGNIVANATLFRLGFVADLVTATSSLLVAMTLYRLFKHVNRNAAAAMVVFMAIGTGMILVNLIFHFAALLVATDAAYAVAPQVGASDTLVLLLMDMHRYGSVISGIMFGLWLLPMGYLAYTSGMFPRALGVVLMIACFGYEVDTLTTFLLPGLGETFSLIVLAPAVVAEFWMIGYLLAIGVRTAAPA